MGKRLFSALLAWFFSWWREINRPVILSLLEDQEERQQLQADLEAAYQALGQANYKCNQLRQKTAQLEKEREESERDFQEVKKRFMSLLIDSASWERRAAAQKVFLKFLRARAILLTPEEEEIVRKEQKALLAKDQNRFTPVVIGAIKAVTKFLTDPKKPSPPKNSK